MDTRFAHADQPTPEIHSCAERPEWYPWRPLAPLMSPPLPKWGKRAGALTYQLVYQFVLRSSYSNGRGQLLQVFNALFHPPRSPLPVGLTLNEWEQMWVHRPFYRFDRSPHRVLHTLDTLMCGSWVCYQITSDTDSQDVAFQAREDGRWDDVAEYIELCARRAGVTLRNCRPRYL